MIKTNELSFTYKEGISFHFPDISISEGDKWLLTGRSGKGKTTLLHLISGILLPHSGHVSIADSNLSELKGRKLDKFRGRNIGMVFQKNIFIGSLNMIDNLLLAQSLPDAPVDKPLISQLMTETGIDDLKENYPADLSQGELQRFSLVRSLVNRPQILLADEPTSALDDHNCDILIQTIDQICSSHNLTLLIATHDQRLKMWYKNVIQLD